MLTNRAENQHPYLLSFILALPLTLAPAQRPPPTQSSAITPPSKSNPQTFPPPSHHRLSKHWTTSLAPFRTSTRHNILQKCCVTCRVRRACPGARCQRTPPATLLRYLQPVQHGGQASSRLFLPSKCGSATSRFCLPFGLILLREWSV